MSKKKPKKKLFEKDELSEIFEGLKVDDVQRLHQFVAKNQEKPTPKKEAQDSEINIIVWNLHHLNNNTSLAVLKDIVALTHAFDFICFTEVTGSEADKVLPKLIDIYDTYRQVREYRRKGDTTIIYFKELFKPEDPKDIPGAFKRTPTSYLFEVALQDKPLSPFKLEIVVAHLLSNSTKNSQLARQTQMKKLFDYRSAATNNLIITGDLNFSVNTCYKKNDKTEKGEIIQEGDKRIGQQKSKTEITSAINKEFEFDITQHWKNQIWSNTMTDLSKNTLNDSIILFKDFALEPVKEKCGVDEPDKSIEELIFLPHSDNGLVVVKPTHFRRLRMSRITDHFPVYAFFKLPTTLQLKKDNQN